MQRHLLSRWTMQTLKCLTWTQCQSHFTALDNNLDVNWHFSTMCERSGMKKNRLYSGLVLFRFWEFARFGTFPFKFSSVLVEVGLGLWHSRVAKVILFLIDLHLEVFQFLCLPLAQIVATWLFPQFWYDHFTVFCLLLQPLTSLIIRLQNIHTYHTGLCTVYCCTLLDCVLCTGLYCVLLYSTGLCTVYCTVYCCTLLDCVLCTGLCTVVLYWTVYCVLLYHTGLCTVYWTVYCCTLLDCVLYCVLLYSTGLCTVYWTVLLYHTGLCTVVPYWTVYCVLDCVLLYTTGLCTVYCTVYCCTLLDCTVLCTGLCTVVLYVSLKYSSQQEQQSMVVGSFTPTLSF